jgi:hypothetical protein
MEITSRLLWPCQGRDSSEMFLATQLPHIDFSGHNRDYKSVLETTTKLMLKKGLDGKFEELKKRKELSSSIRRLSVDLKRDCIAVAPH